MEYKVLKVDELAHHGIRGMKWGVRRYQNKDGSLTAAGQKRRAKLESKLDKLGGKKETADEAATVKPAKKTASNMSDDELARAITRARMEDEYRRLRPEPQPVEKRAFMKQMVNEVVKPAMINSGKKALEASMTKVIERITNGKVDPNSIEALKKTYEKLDYKQKIDKILNPDKYLSEEDKNKRQQREFNAEDRAAQKAANEDARKAAADEAARKANEPISEQYYNSSYRSQSGEKTDVRSNYYNTDQAMSVVDSYNNSYVSSLSKTSVEKGKSNVDEYSGQYLLDKYGRVIRRID